MSSCSICNTAMVKSRVHYGGVSCYSCRAFFRRTTQKEELKRCKFDGNCSLDHHERKSCRPCRYDRCLRAGMRPSLVLDEDEKKKRFKIYSEGSSHPPAQKGKSQTAIVDNVDASKVICRDRKSPEREELWSDEVEEVEDDEEIEEIEEVVEYVDAERIFCELAENESFIDPETGEFVQPGGPPGSDKICDAGRMSDDDIILHYLHKKFRSPDLLTKESHNTSGAIRTLKIKKTVEAVIPTTTSQYLVSQQVRKSVIVRRQDARTEMEIEVEMNSGSNETNQFKISLNVQDLEILFTSEEEKFFQNTFQHFASCWHSIPQGSELISMYSVFCQNPKPLSLRFMKLMTGQLKERLITFIISAEEMANFTPETRFTLLQRSLPEATVMAKVWGSNVPTVEEEIDFVLADSDRRQFRIEGRGARGMKINEIISFAPIPDWVKRTFLEQLKTVSHRILADKIVFMLTLMLIVFNDETDVTISHIKDQYSNMLSRYLNKRYGEANLSNMLNAVFTCINLLPTMAAPFRMMMMNPNQ